VMQAHEGKVWARSKLGQGSEFVLRLRHLATAEPSETASLAAVHREPPEDAASAAAAGGRGGRANG